MSTRSKIGVLRKDGSVDHIYCHWDGYPEHNGVILYNYYSNINKLNELIANGDMSLLATRIYPEPDKPHEFDNIDGTRQDDVCVFYNRERKEDWKHTNPRHSKNLDRFMKECKLSDCDYVYLFDEKNKDWIYSSIPYSRDTDMDFVSLGDSLLNMNCEIDDTVKEDYLIFDGIELMKDLDYYEYVDCYSNNSEAYFNIKDSFKEDKIESYANNIKSYLTEDNQDNILDYINKLNDYFRMDLNTEL